MPWEHHPRVLSMLKLVVVAAGRKPRTIVGGIFRGIRMHLDLQIQTQLYLGQYEREIHGWLARLSSGVQTAMDVGAAEGAFTLYFLLRSSARYIIAFEPSQEAMQHLVRNLHLNNCDADPRLTLVSHFAGERDRGHQRSIDSLLPNIKTPCLVKIDVEGGELDVLRGAPKLLALRDVRWIIETHSLELERECSDLLQSSGLATRIVRNAWWRILLPEMRPVNHNRWLIGYEQTKSS